MPGTLYGVANSLAMNGVSSSAKVVTIIPIWRKALFVLTGLLSLLAITLCAKAVKRTEWKA